jgi:UDP-3-O-[3-hydroxymyristoyl] glucosamine N-acyltransferase
LFHSSATYIVHDGPRLTFVRSLHFLIDEGFLNYFSWENPGEQSAKIHPSAIIKDGCIICGGSTVGSGAVVTKDFLAGATHIGVPARKLGGIENPVN